MTRLLLVEDHVLVRQSIRAFLENEGFIVVGEASTGQEALILTQTLLPDVILVDIHLSGMNGIEVTRRIHHQYPHIRLIALTAYNEKAYQRALLEAGADAFVLKTVEVSELLHVIKRVIASASTAPAQQETPPKMPYLLTERELEVLACAQYGWTNKQIGTELGISDRTVQVHLQAIYQKLGVMNRTEAVRRGLALKLI